MASLSDHHHATGDENGKEMTGEQHKSRRKSIRDRSGNDESRAESKSPHHRRSSRGSGRSLQSMNSTESGRSSKSRRRRSSKSLRRSSSHSLQSTTSHETGRSSRGSRRDQSSKSSRSRSSHIQHTGSIGSLESFTSNESGRSKQSRRDRSNKAALDLSPESRKIRMALEDLGIKQAPDVDSTKANRAKKDAEAKRRGKSHSQHISSVPGAHSSTSVDDSVARRKERGNGKSRDRDRNAKDRVKRDRQNGVNLPGAHSSTSVDDSVARRKERGNSKSGDRNAKERIKRDRQNGVNLPGAHCSTSADDSVTRRKEQGNSKSGGRIQRTDHAGAHASTSEDRRARRKEGRQNRDGRSSLTSEEQKVEEGLIVMNGETLVAARTVEEVEDQQNKEPGSNDRLPQNQLNENEERAEELRRQLEENVVEEKRLKRRLCLIILFVIFVLGGGGAAAYFGLLRPKPADAEPPKLTDTSQSPTDLISSKPSDAPSNGPTEQALSLKYPLPSEEDCQKIANGAPLDGQETLEVRNFFVLMDVELSQEEVEIEPQLPVLEEQIRKLLLPRLAGCRIDSTSTSTGKDLPGVRRLQAEEDVGLAFVRNVIANGMVEAKLKDSVECEAERFDPCHVVEVILDLSLLGPEKYFTIYQIISKVFEQDGNKLKGTLQLGEDYFEVTVRKIGSMDPTPVPSISPSATPSVGPTLYPTATPSLRPTQSPASAPVVTDSPTELPSSTPSAVLVTNVPTKTPSKAPTKSPTMAPTPTPTNVPFPGATPLPTSTASTEPSIAPSTSTEPSIAPSSNPSSKPSSIPSSSPSSKPSTTPSSNPSSNKPSLAPSAVPSSYPSSNRPSVAPSVAPSPSPSRQLSIPKWIQLGSDIDGEAAGDWSGFSVAISSDGKTVAIGALYNDNDNADNSGHVRVYSFDDASEQWGQVGQDIDGEVLHDIGNSVSLSSDGKTVAIGSTSSGTGLVRVYSLDHASTQWVQVGQNIPGGAAGSTFGSVTYLLNSVSLSSNGKTLAIGAPFGGYGYGHVHVHSFDDASEQWVQVGSKIWGKIRGHKHGHSVSLSSDGKTVAIGAPSGDQVSVYRVDDPSTDEWRQVGSDIDGEADGDQFGDSVSLSSDGKTVAIGAKRNDGNGGDSGHVRVYSVDDPSTDEWRQVGSDIDGEADGDWSGSSVSLSSDGKTVAIGAPNNGRYSGHVRVYSVDDSGTQWSQLGSDIDGESFSVSGKYQGLALSSDGKTVAIGATFHGGDCHVRVFRVL